MKKNKGLKIAIIILIILIVLVIATLALLYVFTDLFKSDKQLFAKYAASMMDEKTAFFPTTLEEYTNKKESTPYTTNGSFSTNITAPNSSSTSAANTTTSGTTSSAMITADPTAQINSMLSFGNNTRINFSGKVDTLNNKSEQDINIFYTNNVSLPFKFKNVGDIYALQADFVLPNYIGIENNNIPELLQKFGINVSSLELPSKIEIQEIQSLKLSEEEISHLYNNYIVPVINNLTDDKFSKLENADGSISYTITLTYEDIKNIFIQELQTLSQDTVVIDKINSIYQELYSQTNTIITSDDINDLVANLQETEVDDGDIAITITQKDGSVNQISLNITTESNNYGVITRNEENTNTDASDDLTETIITISKNETDSNFTYSINLIVQNEDAQISGGIEMSYNNLNTNTVAENYSITANLNNMTNMEYNFANNVSFVDSVNIEDFDLNNTIILNNYPDTEVQTFMSQLGNIIAQKNASQMQEIGYPTELINPMYMWFMGPSLSLYIYNMASDVVGSADLSLNSQAVALYNQEFLQYEGTRTGTQVRTLINIIMTHNDANVADPSKQIQITNENYGNGGTLAAPTTPIGELQTPAVVAGREYTVTFAYDPTTGYITACGISE